MQAPAIYSREEVYDYQQAASIIGCSYHSVSDAVRMKILGTVMLPPSNKKFIPRVEVDTIAGMKKPTSKDARAKLADIRGPRNYVDEEHSYGQPIVSLPDPLNMPAGDKDVDKLLAWASKTIRESVIDVVRTVMSY